MSHLEEGMIIAIRDRMPTDGDAAEHVAGCGHCRAALAEARERATAIEAALGALNDPIDVESAKHAVRARLDVQRARSGAPRRFGVHLGRAAAVLLVAAGVVYALPESPLRAWISGAESPAAATVTESTGPAQETPAEGGIEVDVADGSIAVVLTGMRPGAELEILWTDVATARIAAAPGSSFSFASGRAEAAVTDGPVRVELPRFAPFVSVSVDGRTYLRRSSGSLEVLEPVAERSDDRIVFVVSPG